MNLTEEQKEALTILSDQLCLPIYSSKVFISTMKELQNLELVELRKDKRDLEYWYLTNKGNLLINK